MLPRVIVEGPLLCRVIGSDQHLCRAAGLAPRTVRWVLQLPGFFEQAF